MPAVLNDLDFKNVATGINLPTPTADGHIANKAYVDAVAQGLKPHDSCRVATIANITLATAPAQIDSVTMAQDDRVLVKDQTDPTENGIYVYNGAGNAMTRAADMPTSSHAQGVFVFIVEGSTHGSQQWVCTTEAPDDVVGTDELTFTQYSAVAAYTFRDGLKRTGNYVDVDPDPTKGLEILGGAGTSGKLAVNLDTAAYSGNGAGLQFDQSGANGGLSAKVDGTLVVVNSSGNITLGSGLGVRKYAVDVGDGVNKDITVTHSLNTTDVQVEIRYAADPKTVVIVDWKVTGVNTIQINFKTKPGSAEFRVVVLG
jgi:hypothetical protein